MISLSKFNIQSSKLNSKGFTLLELLIVVSIIAILSVALVIVLNPAETLKKSRDSTRIADLNAVKTALSIMLTSTSTPSLDNQFGASTSGCTTGTNGALGTTPKIRYSGGTSGSITVGGLLTAGSDSAFTTWVTGTAVNNNNAGKVDGNGWIPANLTGLTGGSPISNYPIDPINTLSGGTTATSSDLVYRFACQNASNGGKPGYIFELDAQLESDAFTVADDKRKSDGGDNDVYYEVGNSLRLLPTGAAATGF